MDKKLFKKIYVEITNICNLNCSFCLKGKRTSKTMTIEEFKIIAKEVCKYTNLVALHVKGEPLLHENLSEILEICNNNNLKVNLTTNAVKIKECEKTLLTSKSLRQINISLHSIEENDLDKKYKENYLKNIFEFADKLKKSHIILSLRLWNISNLENENNFEIIKQLSKNFNIKNLIQLIKENKFVELDKNIFLNQDYEFEWPQNLEKIDEKVYGTCQGLRNHIAILSNGDVVPCCLDQNGEITLGNILKEPLRTNTGKRKSSKYYKRI